MKVKDYEYNNSEEYEISEERKDELIKKIKDQIKKGFIAHYQILEIGKNDQELDYIYDWLDENDIEIRGINGTISGEIPNFSHFPRMGQSITPDVVDDEEQKRLFSEFDKFSDEDKTNNTEEYLKARNKLVEHNMKLAKWVSNWKGLRDLKIPKEDRDQMAYLGLIDAVEKFNPKLGYKFSTYATKAIYRRIEREIYRSDENLKMNMTFNEQLALLPEIENKISVELGREAKPEEIADILGVTMDKVKELENARKLQEKESLEQIEEKRNDPETIFSNISDDEKLIETDDGYVKDGVYMDEEDTLPAGFRNNDRTANKVIANELRQQLNEILFDLHERERLVIELRFGLEGNYPRTLEEIGKYFNVTRERIKDIEAKALRKLQKPLRIKQLKPYLDAADNEELEQM